MPKVTDISELINGISLDDLIHLIDVSDTTDDAAGSSFKVKLRNLLKGKTLTFILGCLVYKRTGTDDTIIQDADWVFYMNSVTNRLVIGIGAADVTTIPDDLDDSAKFIKFYDGNSLTP
nr:hypothetical protein [uncultured Allomuricauda sp.]